MKQLNLIILGVILFVTSGNTSNNIKIRDICKWHHEEIVGWHQNYILFKKKYTKISDKTKYSDTNDKTIEKHLLKQKKLIEAIDKAEKKIQSSSKVYHYLECTRFERKFEKD